MLPRLRLKIAPSRIGMDDPFSIYVLRLHSLPELCLAQVIGDMRRSAEYNGEPIAMRLPQEILFRHSAMLLQPVSGELVWGVDPTGNRAAKVD